MRTVAAKNFSNTLGGCSEGPREEGTIGNTLP